MYITVLHLHHAQLYRPVHGHLAQLPVHVLAQLLDLQINITAVKLNKRKSSILKR